MEKKLYSYKDIEALVIQYKEGSRDASGELFKAFAGFIAKYANFLKFGVLGKKDRDLRGLTHLLCPKNDNVRARMGLIRDALRSYEYEDIVGELNVLFLKSVAQFKTRESKLGGNVPFAGYLYSYFKFMVKRWIDQRLVDVMNTVKLVELTEEEKELQILEDTKDFEAQFSGSRPVLDSVTRWILHLYYSKGLRDQEIGKIIRVSGNWVCCQRRAALKKLHDLGMDQVIDVIRQQIVAPTQAVDTQISEPQEDPSHPKQ